LKASAGERRIRSISDFSDHTVIIGKPNSGMQQSAKDILSAAGLRTPRGRSVSSPEEAATAATELGRVVIKPLILRGGRGKAGLIRFANDPSAAHAEAQELLSLEGVAQLRVEEHIEAVSELYVCVVTDRASRAPMLIYSESGGVDVEAMPETAFIRRPLDIRQGVEDRVLEAFPPSVRETLRAMVACYRAVDAELVEINPLAVDREGAMVALDAKLIVDDAALHRHPELPQPAPSGPPLERTAADKGLYYVQLDGTVGVIANGAGLTMATLDAVRFHGGRPANFMEIGGDAYKKGQEALQVVLAHPTVRSLLINLCGAYARTDVMIEGLLAGWSAVPSTIPVAFSIHGTGQERAIALVRETLGVEPFEAMDDAVREAVHRA
jgi:succinyl-CoA synthetase beta subunit